MKAKKSVRTCLAVFLLVLSLIQPAGARTIIVDDDAPASKTCKAFHLQFYFA